MVRAVKRHENGFISDPVVLGPAAIVADVLDIKARFGFCGIPITGEWQARFIGVVMNNLYHTFVLPSSTPQTWACGVGTHYLRSDLQPLLRTVLIILCRYRQIGW